MSEEHSAMDEDRARVVREAFAEGKANCDFHLDCANAITSTAMNTLTLIAAAAYGALGYGAHLLESGGLSAPAVAVLAVAAHLLMVAALIVVRCLRAAPFEPTSNEAGKLMHPGYQWEEILEVEIRLLDERIGKNRERNASIGRSLNRLTLSALAAPITFGAAWAVAATALG